jgi:Protein of unknown function (DUF2628)
MPVYTVHLPTRGLRDTLGVVNELRPPDAATLVKAKFVPECFSRAAFFLGPIWLAWQGLWLESLVWLVAFSLLAIQHVVGTVIAFLIGVLLEILLGLEANNLRRARLKRRGYSLVDVAAGATRDDAERGFFRRYLESGLPQPDKKMLSASTPPPPQAEVLGVFPLPEDPR